MNVDPSEDEAGPSAAIEAPVAAKNGKKKTASETYTKVRRICMCAQTHTDHANSFHKSSIFSRDPIRILGVWRLSRRPCGHSTRTLREWFTET